MAISDLKVRITADTSAFHKELDAAIAKVKAYKAEFGPVAALFNFFQGRCTFFACLFTGVGIALAFLGKLTAEYVALVGGIQALLLAHSAKEDYHERATQPDGAVEPTDPSAAQK